MRPVRMTQCCSSVLSSIAGAAVGNEEIANAPLLKERPEKRIQVILVTSDRGLAGAFNANLLKATQRFIDEHPDASIELELMGRKGRDFFRRRSYPISGDHIGILNKPAYADASGIARRIIQRFENDEIDSVYVIYNDFQERDVARLDRQQSVAGRGSHRGDRSIISLNNRWSR